MQTCPQCGRQTAAPGPCPRCGGDEAPRSDSQVRLDPARLAEAPVRRHALNDGKWGSGVSEPGAPAQFADPAGSRPAPRERPSAAPERTPTPPPDAPDDRPRTASSPPPAPQTSLPPPVLASDALRRDLRPSAPGARGLRVVGATLGVAGIATAIWVAGATAVGVPLTALFTAVAAAALVPTTYSQRALAMVVASGLGLALGAHARRDGPGAPEELVLAIGVTWLSAALHFRGWHRASTAARWLVALGLAVCIGWLLMTGALTHLSMLETDWQGFMPRIMQVPFALLLVLSLLAFMDARTTGACGVWAASLLVWYGLHSGVELLARLWPVGSTGPSLARAGAEATAGRVAVVFFVTLLSLGLAQLMAAGASKRAPD